MPRALGTIVNLICSFRSMVLTILFVFQILTILEHQKSHACDEHGHNSITSSSLRG